MSIRKRIWSTSSLKVLRFCVSYDAQRVMFAIAQFLVLVVVWQRAWMLHCSDFWFAAKTVSSVVFKQTKQTNLFDKRRISGR